MRTNGIFFASFGVHTLRKRCDVGRRWNFDNASTHRSGERSAAREKAVNANTPKCPNHTRYDRSRPSCSRNGQRRVLCGINGKTAHAIPIISIGNSNEYADRGRVGGEGRGRKFTLCVVHTHNLSESDEFRNGQIHHFGCFVFIVDIFLIILVVVCCVYSITAAIQRFWNVNNAPLGFAEFI